DRRVQPHGHPRRDDSGGHEEPGGGRRHDAGRPGHEALRGKRRAGVRRRVETVHRFDVPVGRGFAFITDTANWSSYWPGFVRLEAGSRWNVLGVTPRIVTRLLGRDRELVMTLRAFEQDRLVTYTSTQPGLPDAEHERHFEADGEGFRYRPPAGDEPPRGAPG